MTSKRDGSCVHVAPRHVPVKVCWRQYPCTMMLFGYLLLRKYVECGPLGPIWQDVPGAASSAVVSWDVQHLDQTVVQNAAAGLHSISDVVSVSCMVAAKVWWFIQMF